MDGSAGHAGRGGICGGIGIRAGFSFAVNPLALFCFVWRAPRPEKASPPQTVTVVNIGASPVHITSIAITGDYTQTNDCPAPRQPSQRTTPARSRSCSSHPRRKTVPGFLPSRTTRPGARSGDAERHRGACWIRNNGVSFFVGISGSEDRHSQRSTNITVSNPGEIRALISNIDSDGDYNHAQFHVLEYWAAIWLRSRAAPSWSHSRHSGRASAREGEVYRRAPKTARKPFR